jgi:hypothetical protein
MTDGLSRFGAELIELLKAHELDKALKLAANARHFARAGDLEARQRGVDEASRGIRAAREMRARILQQAENQPDAQRAYAREQLERVCRELFDPQIANLQTRKRELSRPHRIVG